MFVCFSYHCTIVILALIFFILLYIIFIKSLSHSEHIRYTAAKLSHSLYLLFFPNNHWVVLIKYLDCKMEGWRESMLRTLTSRISFLISNNLHRWHCGLLMFPKSLQEVRHYLLRLALQTHHEDAIYEISNIVAWFCRLNGYY